MNTTEQTTTYNTSELDFYSTTAPTPPDQDSGIIAFLFTVDFLLIFLNLSGNTLTIVAINLSKKLSALLSNQFIFNLALSDILVGLSIPYHNLFYFGEQLEKLKYMCILKFVFIFFACSSSIYNLFGIAADRYLAVVYPLHYSKYMTRKVAFLISCFGWLLSLFLALVVIWWNKYEENNGKCELIKVVPEFYLMYVSVPMFLLIWAAILVLYTKIWKEAKIHTKRMKNFLGCPYDTVPDDSKSIQLICFILGCFTVCWLPYFVYIVVVTIYGPIYNTIVYEIAFTMAMTNSCMNPIIYAWKNRNFRTAFWCLLRCKSPNSNNKKTFITNHTPRQNGIPNNCNGISNFIFDEDFTSRGNLHGRKESDTNFSVQTEKSIVHF